MFSLVTALVSPQTIEVLRLCAKKESLATTLSDSANVVCFQPTDSVCLLQGEWENIKKAYVVLEELYFRAQAEAMVREMLKDPTSASAAAAATSADGKTLSSIPTSILSSLFPPPSSSSINSAGLSSATAEAADHSRRWSPLKMAAGGWPPDGVTGDEVGFSKGVTEHSRKQRNSPCVRRRSFREDKPGDVLTALDDDGVRRGGGGVALATVAALDDDDEPPILSRENINGADGGGASFSDASSSSDREYDCVSPADPRASTALPLHTRDFFSTTDSTARGQFGASASNGPLGGSATGGVVVGGADCSLMAAETQIAAMEKALQLGRSAVADSRTREGGERGGAREDARSSGIDTIHSTTVVVSNGSSLAAQSPVAMGHQRSLTPGQASSLALSQGSLALSQGSLALSQPSLALSQRVAAAYRTQQFFSTAEAAGDARRLPQFSSLFMGVGASSGGGGGGGHNGGPGGGAAGGTSSSWSPYADLYSMHLSALHSMRIKQETTAHGSGGLPGESGDGDAPGDIKDIELGYRLDGDDSASSVGGGAAGSSAANQEMRCTRCDKTYRSEARMKEHVRTHERDYVPVLHSCPKCGKSFTYRHNMVVHLRRFHFGWQPAKRHACRVCGVRFQKPYLLRLHEHKSHVVMGVGASVGGAMGGVPRGDAANSFE